MEYLVPTVAFLSTALRACALLLVTWWGSWLWGRRKLYALSAAIPGPPALPLLGNSVQLGCFNSHEDMISQIGSIKRTYGEYFRLWLGPELGIVLSEPEDYEAVLLSKSTSSKGRKYDVLKTVIGDGILTGSGARWKKFRHMINPAFALATIRSYQSLHNKHAKYLIEELNGYCDKGLVKIDVPAQRYTADCICESLFDIPLDFYKGKKDDVLMSTPILTQVLYERICKVWLLPELSYRFSKTYRVQVINDKLYKECYHTALRDQMNVYISRKKDTLNEDATEWEENNTPKGRKPRSVLATVMDAVVSGEASPQDVLTEFDNIFNPGMDTIYTQISALMMLMGMHRQYQNTLWEEIREMYKDDWEADVTSEHMSKLPYLDMCTKEVIRMFSTASCQMRHVHEDFFLKSRNIVIPANASIILVPFLLHRHPKYWKNPTAFMPERFLPEENAKRPHFAYVPFSAGLRNCIGQTIGIDILKTAIIHLMRNFEFYSDLKMENLKLKADISVRSVHGYRVCLRKRNREM